MRKQLLILGIVCVSGQVDAQSFVSFGGGSYFQDFDGFTPTGSSNFLTSTGNDLSALTGVSASMVGWHALKEIASGTPNIQQNNGLNSTGTVYSYGTNGASDRALGSVASNASGMIDFGVRLRNTSGRTLGGSLALRFDGEQWRNGGNTSPQTLAFSFKKQSAAAWNVLDLMSGSGFTPASAFDFTSPTVGASSGALDGNLAANRVANINGIIALGSDWAPGEEVILRWTDLNDAGGDHGLAIDNFSAVSVPEPASAALLTIYAIAVFARRKGRNS